MFSQPLVPLKKSDSKKTLKKINPLLDSCEYNEDQTSIMAVDLPFYHGYRFLSVTDHNVHPEKKHYVIDGDNDAYIINFTNELIYDLNQKLPILLTEDTVIDYVRFFLEYVVGDFGKITPAENVDDIQWKDNPPPNAKKAIAGMIAPLDILSGTQGQDFTITGYFIFKTDLLKANLVIDKNGHITMENEEILIEEMPILDDVIGQ